MTNPLILYSTNARLAYNIAEYYYGRIHYVWCSGYFDSVDRLTPPSSTPGEIYRRLANEARRGDRGSEKIKSIKFGILRGANKKEEAGIITPEQYKDIKGIVNGAETAEFEPLLYVIPFSGVSCLDLIEVVPPKKRSGSFSSEYKIERLPASCFDVVRFTGAYCD